MKNKYKLTRVFEQKIPIRLKSCLVNICIYTHSSFASRMRTRAYITYVCACARARMTERVSALTGQKIAGNISQNRAKIAEKSFFKIGWKTLCVKVLRRFMVAVFVSFFYCEKRQKNTFKKVLTYRFIEFSIRHIEKQQTKNRQ